MNEQRTYIDREKCNACGLCVKVCKGGSILLPDEETGQPNVTADHAEFCIQCGQCMAVCAPQAIHIAGLSYERDLYPYTGAPASTEAFLALLERRRSTRVYKDEPVAQEAIEQLVNMITLAPMSFPPHKVELTIVNGREKIAAALPAFVALYEKFLQRMRRPMMRIFIRRSMSEGDWKVIAGHLEPLLRKVLPEMKSGVDYVTYDAPALILFHSDKNEGA
ncbi:MAG: nitroreductase family protein, partial [Alphaproteobacteria bacterium]